MTLVRLAAAHGARLYCAYELIEERGSSSPHGLTERKSTCKVVEKLLGELTDFGFFFILPYKVRSSSSLSPRINCTSEFLAALSERLVLGCNKHRHFVGISPPPVGITGSAIPLKQRETSNRKSLDRQEILIFF